MPKKFKAAKETELDNFNDELTDDIECLESQVDTEGSFVDPLIETASIAGSDIAADNDVDNDDRLAIEEEQEESNFEGTVESNSNGAETAADDGCIADKSETKRRKIKNFSCEFCRKKFVTESGLEKHMRNIHGKIVVKTEGSNDSGFGNASSEITDDVDNSVASNEEAKSDSQNENACQECGKIFATKTGVRQHMEYVHLSKPEPCFVCNRPFKNKVTLKHHLKHQHNLNDNVNIYT